MPGLREDILAALERDTSRPRRRKKRDTPKAPKREGGTTPGRPLPDVGSDAGSCVARCAERQVGKRYVWATAGPNTFDCSGLVAYCVKQCTGKEISRSSYDQARLGTPVAQPQRGDILIYGNGSHVGIATAPNRQVTALNKGAGVITAAIPGNMGLPYNGARRIVSGAPSAPLSAEPDTATPGPLPITKYVAHDLPGSSEPLYLPEWLPFRVQLTTVRPNRTHRHMTPTVTVFHTTNNPRNGENAAAHANWQAQGTPGHPDGAVSVHGYVDAREVVWTLPIDEEGIHSGDWRNEWGIAVERTTNADQQQWAAENNAMHVHAGLLYILDKTAPDAMYPHTNGGHCPRLVKPWSEIESIVDTRIGRIGEANHAR